MAQNIKSEMKLMLKYAMNYGIILGLFWFIKYIFLISSAFFVHFIYVYHLLSIGTLILYYVLLTRYRDKGLDGYISYAQSIIFSFFLFLFAGMIESVLVYLHIAIIDTSFIAEQGRTLTEVILEFFRQIGLAATSIQGVKGQPIPSNAFYVADTIFTNSLIGFCLSLIYGIFVRRKKD